MELSLSISSGIELRSIEKMQRKIKKNSLKLRKGEDSIIIGVDPSMRNTGIVIIAKGNNLPYRVLNVFTIITTSSNDGECLSRIKNELEKIVLPRNLSKIQVFMEYDTESITWRGKIPNPNAYKMHIAVGVIEQSLYSKINKYPLSGSVKRITPSELRKAVNIDVYSSKQSLHKVIPEMIPSDLINCKEIEEYEEGELDALAAALTGLKIWLDKKSSCSIP